MIFYGFRYGNTKGCPFFVQICLLDIYTKDGTNKSLGKHTSRLYIELQKKIALFAIMEQQDFRSICAQFATGITVITTTYNGKPYGFTANSFTSVSLEPAIVLFCLKTASETNTAFQASRTFTINILSDKQENVSNAFASSKNNQKARFEQVELISNKSTLIKGGIGYLAGEIIRYEEVGDHIVYYGQVKEGNRSEGKPLLYVKGGYQRLG